MSTRNSQLMCLRSFWWAQSLSRWGISSHLWRKVGTRRRSFGNRWISSSSRTRDTSTQQHGPKCMESIMCILWIQLIIGPKLQISLFLSVCQRQKHFVTLWAAASWLNPSITRFSKVGMQPKCTSCAQMAGNGHPQFFSHFLGSSLWLSTLSIQAIFSTVPTMYWKVLHH